MDHNVCFVELELLPIEGIFDLCGSCDLDLDPMTFIYKRSSYPLEMYWMSKYELPMSRLSKVII